MRYMLFALAGEQKGACWEVGPAGLTLGRDPDNDVPVGDATASRRHCRIVAANGGLLLEDLASRNPALLNGRIVNREELHEGDEIAIGQERFCLSVMRDRTRVVLEEKPSQETLSWEKAGRVSMGVQATAPSDAALPHTVRDLAFLHGYSRRLGAHTDPRGLFEVTRQALVERFAPESSRLLHVHEGALCRPDATGLDDPRLKLMQRALEEGSGLLAPMRRRGTGSRARSIALVCPVIFGDLVLAMFYVETGPPRGIYDEEDLRMLILLAQALAPFINAVNHLHQVKRDNEWLRAQGGTPMELKGASKALHDVRELARRAARSDLNILILGETGTGKELVARLVRHLSPCASAPFEVVNCAAIPGELIESELFGHEEGAFTGAQRRHLGRIEQAAGGMLFLDEVGELPASHQARLLRVLEEGAFRRVGGETDIPARVRFIAATNADLRQAMETGQFRRDLFYRLNGFEIHVPPLRERTADIPVLAEHFFALARARAKRSFRAIDAAALDYLREQPWPGNVRELRNCIERAVSTARGDTITLADVAAAASATPQREDAVLSLAEAEARYIERILRQSEGNFSTAARTLAISRTTLYRKVEEYGITP